MKKKVAIIGVTGSVGQEFVQSLHNHPGLRLRKLLPLSVLQVKSTWMQSEITMELLRGM